MYPKIMWVAMNSSDEPNITFEDITDIPATKSDGQAPLRLEELIGQREHPGLTISATELLPQELFAEAQELRVPEHRNLPVTETEPLRQDLLPETQQDLEATELLHDQNLLAEERTNELEDPTEETAESQSSDQQNLTFEPQEAVVVPRYTTRPHPHNAYEEVEDTWQLEDQEDNTFESVKKAKKKKRKRKQTLKPRIVLGDSLEFDDSEDLPLHNESVTNEKTDSAQQTHIELREQLIGEILENSLKSLVSSDDQQEKTQRKLRRSSILQTKILPQDLLEDILNSSNQDLVAQNEKSGNNNNNKKRKLKKSVATTKAIKVVGESSDFTPHLNGDDELIGWDSFEAEEKSCYYTTSEDEYEASTKERKKLKKKKKQRRASLSTTCEGTSTATDLVENSALDDGSANCNEFGYLNPTKPSKEDWSQLPKFQPFVLLQRITQEHIAKYKRRPGRPRKSNIAKKHTRSYFVPNLKGRDPLKLTLKLSAASSVANQSFEVVANNTILIGPGGTFNLNGSDFNEVKQEITDKEEDLLPSVEGSVVRLGEEGEGVGTDVDHESQTQPSKEPEEPDGVAESRFDESDKTKESEQQDGLSNNDDREESEPEEEEGEEEEEEEEEEEDEEGGVDEDLAESSIDIKDNIVEDSEALNERDSLEEVCRETINDLKRLEEAEESGSEDDAAPSPTPSEQLRPDFLAPAESPAPGEPMVEHNGALTPAASPAYPPTSPATPAQGEKGDDASKPPGEPSFQWGSSEVNESVTSPSHEEHDPLLIPDQSSGPNALLGPTNESLLRGFLSDADKSAPPVTLSNQDGLLALGSEYMSLERLGEGGSRCDVCGERANDPEGLNEHRARAGHYKCAQPDCGNQVFKSSEDLTAHARVAHPPQFPRPPLVMINQSLQSPPVQQLAQQVQRLPMPQPYLNPHAPMVQLHQMPGFPQDPARRPPPLYRVPAPTSMAPPPHITPQFSNTQQMMSQMFNQQYRHPQTGFMQQMPPSQQQMQQQQQQQQPRPSFMQGPRGPQQQQQQRMASPQQRQQQQQLPQIRAKRMATGPPLGTSPNAKRRMDMLIPDRHDNADCHVIAMQKRTDTGPVINSVEGSKIHLTDSITMSAVGRTGAAVTATPIGAAKNKSDAKAVANVLASRGITVTPAGGGNNNVRATNQRQTPPRPVQVPAVPTPVTTLNLNSAISIIPTGNQNSGFAVPQNRAVNRQQNQTNVVERPPRPPTVDLTGDGPTMGGHSRQMHGNHMRGRMRGRPPGSGGGGGRNQCQICDKAFSTEESLAQHMQLHRSPGKLPYRCNLCPAQYPTQQGLLQHRQVYHKEPTTGPGELALPVVDLKQPGTLSRLASMGIQHYLPLSQLSSQQGGYFGLPIVSIDGARNPAVCNLGALGATNILSLGPMKPLPR